MTLFTNRAGRFVLQGLKLGRYEIRLGENQQRRVRFEIPADQSGLYDLGILKLSATEAATEVL